MSDENEQQSAIDLADSILTNAGLPSFSEVKSENERLRRKLLGASEHLRIHGYGFGEHDSRRYECERISKEWATDALAARGE